MIAMKKFIIIKPKSIQKISLLELFHRFIRKLSEKLVKEDGNRLKVKMKYKNLLKKKFKSLRKRAIIRVKVYCKKIESSSRFQKIKSGILKILIVYGLYQLIAEIIDKIINIFFKRDGMHSAKREVACI